MCSPLETKHLICDLCDYRTERKECIRDHMNYKHMNLKSKRKTCFKIFDNAFKLKLHGRIHKKAQRFECLICFKSFTIYTSLRVHVLKSHINEKSAIAHMCDICGKSYYSIIQLTKHMRSHSDKTFVCFDKTCKRKFASRSSRRQHFRFYQSHNFEVNIQVTILRFKYKAY